MKIIKTALPAITVAAAALCLTACATGAGDARGVGSTGDAVGSGSVGLPAAHPPTPLARIVLQRAELPTGFTPSDDPGPALPRAYDDALHTCLGSPATYSAATDRASAESGRDGNGYSGVGLVSTVARFRVQAPVHRDAALLGSPRAEHCYATVLERLFRHYNDGSGLVADRTTVRMRHAGEPDNVAGVVDFRFHTTVGLRQPGEVSMTYLTGPREFGCLSVLGFGRRIDAAAQHRLTAAFAARVAAG